jgi:hypothetical protein
LTLNKAASALRIALVLLAVVLLQTSVAQAQSPPFLTKSAARGFGDPPNRMAWSMVWFKGKLYVGTSRENTCVELATLEFYGIGKFYSSQPWPDLSCPADRYDLNLQAEIWRFTPETGVWERVYRSPADISNPRAPGKFVARDIGFRGMVVKREPDGTEALYVGGVTANEYIPEIAEAYPPRILRSTDGESFTPLAGVPNTIVTVFGQQHPVGFRAMTVYHDRLFVTATGGLLGDGVVMEVKDPAGTSPTFEQVSPPEIRVFEIEVFNDHLYVGAGDLKKGYSVYRTDVNGDASAFKSIITDGGGRGATMTSVVSMHVFRNRLYVGANGYASLLPQSELVRVNPDDSWDLVAGQGRFAPDGSLKFPITGLPDGFGNFFTSHFWRQQTHQGALYVGTLDSSWGLRVIPLLDLFLRPEMGFDVYGTCDGQFWWRVTRDAFGDGRHNIGARTLASTPAGGFVGSYNPAEGTSVWRSTDPSSCGELAAARRQVDDATLAPRKLLADAQRRGVVLSWQRSPGASRYRVMRAQYRVAKDVRVPRPLLGGFVPDTSLPVAGGNGRAATDLSVAGRFVSIGTSKRPVFVDRTAQAGNRALYEVIAIDGRRRSSPSNIVRVPSKRPRVTFAEAGAALRRLAPSLRATLRRALGAAKGHWQRGNRSAALRRLAELNRLDARQAQASTVADRLTAEDLSDVVLRLKRRLRYAGLAGG